MLHNFVYDGNGKDTFFWAGSSNRPSSKGYIVPDKNGRTNVLSRYLNEDFILKLPSLKKISDLKWFSVFDLSTQTNFGDIYIREGFEPPGYQTLTEIYGDLHSVSSKAVVVMDAKTIKIPGFTYDGKGGDVYFFAGEGPQPSSKGFIVPDELGYLAPIGLYKKQDVILQLPGSKSIFDIDWIAVYNRETRKSLGHVIVPESLNVPPSLVEVMEHDTGLDNCMMLHRNMMVSWDSRPPQLTIKLAGHIDDDEYMAFGISGEQGKSVMTGGDVVVAYMDEYLGHADDYNLTAKSVCHKFLVSGAEPATTSSLEASTVLSSMKQRKRMVSLKSPIEQLLETLMILEILLFLKMLQLQSFGQLGKWLRFDTELRSRLFTTLTQGNTHKLTLQARRSC